MISFYIKGGVKQAETFLKSLKIFTLAESLGGVESLAENPALMTHGSVPAAHRKLLGIEDNFIRLSVGIETEADFVSTLKHSYLSDPASPFNLDVNFDESGTRIVSSRFLLMGLFINDSIKESEMVRELRQICQEFSTDDFQVRNFYYSLIIDLLIY